VGILVFNAGPGELKQALLQAQLAWLGLGTVLKVPVMWLKAARWAIAIQQATGRPVRAAFSASMIGFAGNLVLPARLGEWARVSVIDKHNHTGRTLPLSALIATQLFDLLLLVGCFLVVSTYVTDRFADKHLAASGLWLLVLSVFAVFMFLPRKFTALTAWCDPIRKRIPERLHRLIAQKLELCLRGVSCLSDYRAVAKILSLTVIVWAVEAVSVFAVLRAFQIEATVLMATMLVIVSNLSFLVPITPGNIGVTQAVNIFLLGIFGVPAASALAYAVVHQGIVYAVIAGLGLICYYREGMSLKLLGFPPGGETPDEVARVSRG
jgi:hypothetical protein